VAKWVASSTAGRGHERCVDPSSSGRSERRDSVLADEVFLVVSKARIASSIDTRHGRLEFIFPEWPISVNEAFTPFREPVSGEPSRGAHALDRQGRAELVYLEAWAARIYTEKELRLQYALISTDHTHRSLLLVDSRVPREEPRPATIRFLR